jgi:hypothetical protein
MGTLSSSNGLGTLVWDATQYKITEFLEHPYQAASSSTQSRNFAYDSYPGVRIGSTGTWLSTVAPSVVEYVPGTGIIHSQRTLQGLTLDEYDFAPMSLAQNASVMLLKVTGSASGPVDVYSLFNYQVGSGSPTPSNTGETLTYDATKGAYYETGGAGVAMAFAGISTPTYYGSSPNNPYGILMAGGNLQNDPGTGSPTTGAVAGFQTTLGNVALGQTYWVGWVTVLAPDGNGANAMATTRTWIAGRTEEQLLADEESGWASWLTPAPAGASGLEAALDQESQVILRMAQVTEPGAAYGQVLAAISPGEWRAGTTPRRRPRSPSRWGRPSVDTSRTSRPPTAGRGCRTRSRSAGTTATARSGATTTRTAPTWSSTGSVSSSGRSMSTSARPGTRRR